MLGQCESERDGKVRAIESSILRHDKEMEKLVCLAEREEFWPVSGAGHPVAIQETV